MHVKLYLTIYYLGLLYISAISIDAMLVLWAMHQLIQKSGLYLVHGQLQLLVVVGVICSLKIL